MKGTKRNGYIDVIKFIFAIIIMEFHQNTGIFPGGRVVVEGFFMLSGYLMMCYIARNEYPQDNLGVSTVRFIGRKYKLLFPVLLPSIIISYILASISMGRSVLNFFLQSPLLLFELIPLQEAGFAGYYVVGISWYLSAMFISLAALYPLCKKFGSNFVLTACPLLGVMLYGYLSFTYGDLAVATIFRGLGSCALGCVLYEICQRLSAQKVTTGGRILFTVLEIFGAAVLFYMMHFKAKSNYDYVCVFVIFGLLIIGISNLSVFSLLFSARWTKKLGIWSTLLVLNHCCWRSFLPEVLGDQYIHTNKMWLYYLCTIVTCVIVYWLSKLITLIMKCFSPKTRLETK